MKKIILTFVVLATVVSCGKNKKEVATTTPEVVVVEKAATNNIDIPNSALIWKGTKPTGDHKGKVALKSGSLQVDKGALKSGTFVIDMATINNTDIEDAAYKAKLENHLKSPDFFDIEAFPTSTFVITNVTDRDGKLTVTGNLTIKDVTKSISIPATITEQNGVTTFKSDAFMVNRADFNVKYMSKKFFDNLKDKFIDDNMELSFVVQTKK